MADRERDTTWERIEKGYIPQDEGVRGGYQPETSEAGPPPTGGSGGDESDKKDD